MRVLKKTVQERNPRHAKAHPEDSRWIRYNVLDLLAGHWKFYVTFSCFFLTIYLLSRRSFSVGDSGGPLVLKQEKGCPTGVIVGIAR